MSLGCSYSFVWLELHDRLWPFFLDTAEAQQAAVEVRGEVIARSGHIAI